MLPALLSVPAKLATLLARLTSTRATKLDNLDALISSRSTLTQAQATAGVWAAATRTLTSWLTIKSVQRGTLQITASSLTASVTITAVTIGKAFIVTSYSGPWETDDISRVRLSLGATAVTGTRTSGAQGKSSSIVSFEVVEFY